MQQVGKVSRIGQDFMPQSAEIMEEPYYIVVDPQVWAPFASVITDYQLFQSFHGIDQAFSDR